MLPSSAHQEYYWGEPERAPHSRVLKMSVCALLKACLLAFGPPWYTGGGRFRVVEHRANVNVVSLSLTKTTSLFFLTKQLFCCT